MKYPMRWRRNSSSCIRIEQMNDFHLVAAYRRVLRAQREIEAEASLDPVEQAEALPYLLAEIQERKLDPKWKGGKPPEGEPPMEGDPYPEMEP